MPPLERVIIDTSAYYALISSLDNFHASAKLAYGRLLDWEWELWTTSYVLVETSALVHRRLGFEPLKAFMDTALSGLVRVFWVAQATHHDAWRHMLERQGKGLSLVNWTTVVASERLKAALFTFDRGFAQEGLAISPPQEWLDKR